ncbi:UbiA family prenyltransferase [Candidatus Levibacter sp. Uisw_134_01]|uniref:UbiA family prenyltransferase n=1 Tax=Candidatus Levibacter sp. Uisw_134_01 TaxID=3230999 RepID=UPI003D4A3384
MKLKTLFELGRISNLPTVWSNVLAGIVIAGGTIGLQSTSILIASLSLFYIGGMFLNDAFDTKFDIVQRPERPIPSKKITQKMVFIIGFTLLILGIFLLYIEALRTNIFNLNLILFLGMMLSAFIIIYNKYHKNNAYSPLIMGLCRISIYFIVSAFFLSYFNIHIFEASIFLLSYLIGLTYLAKQEDIGYLKNQWPLLFLIAPIIYGYTLIENYFSYIAFGIFVLNIFLALSYTFIEKKRNIKKSVTLLISGICIYDFILIAHHGEVILAILSLVFFVLTLFFQKYIPGT